MFWTVLQGELWAILPFRISLPQWRGSVPWHCVQCFRICLEQLWARGCARLETLPLVIYSSLKSRLHSPCSGAQPLCQSAAPDGWGFFWCRPLGTWGTYRADKPTCGTVASTHQAHLSGMLHQWAQVQGGGRGTRYYRPCSKETYHEGIEIPTWLR